MRRLLIFAAVLLAGCAAHNKPVLYPNAHLQKVGDIQAQRDIDECCRMADSYVKSNPGGEVAGGAVKGGVVGAAAGAAGGAVWGNVGRGAAGGAAVGAAAGATRGLFKAAEPAPVYKNFVNRCLRDKGYDPIGWQ
jgi:outer membrane lipoprotein SlyB